MTGAPGEQGFTLVEVLVAFAILALSLTVLYQLFGDSIGQTKRSDVRREALLIARSKLAEVSTLRPIVLGETTGDAGAEFTWQARIRPSDQADEDRSSAWQLYDIEVAVRATGATSAPLVTLKTQRLAEAVDAR
ncbi:MAG: prepilin-type N-terminal cleavage/methylation domain-containing protein [Sphingomonadales bacterium]|nr:prepilin-type N-terminal cleavage/methylation domain-containing protein [Sphingomonadales bacterium]